MIKNIIIGVSVLCSVSLVEARNEAPPPALSFPQTLEEFHQQEIVIHAHLRNNNGDTCYASAVDERIKRLEATSTQGHPAEALGEIKRLLSKYYICQHKVTDDGAYREKSMEMPGMFFLRVLKRWGPQASSLKMSNDHRSPKISAQRLTGHHCLMLTN